MTDPRSVDALALAAITSIDHDGKRYNVECRIRYDGIEYVGRLWFSEEGTTSVFPDRGTFPGYSKDEVMRLARRLRPDDVRKRLRRGIADKRRFHALRRCTEEILGKIRYLNQVTVSMRGGLLDTDGATQEVALTERQLHELVDRLRDAAGVEE